MKATSDARPASAFQNAIRVNDILIHRGHSMKVVSSSQLIAVRGQWDSKGEYQVNPSTRTPYYTPNYDATTPTPYPVTAIHWQ